VIDYQDKERLAVEEQKQLTPKTDEEKIDAAAAEILEIYRQAFEELAK